MKRRMRHQRHEYPELDITAFMNLMVILVPFLLITAVFSRVTVLDLYLPPESSASDSPNNKFRLEVVIRREQISLLEAASSINESFVKSDGVFNLAAFKESLYQVKAMFPDKQEVTILAEPDINYDILVQVMDALRMREVKGDNSSRLESLFPAVSIGDAPDIGK